ncbi:MAG TPA: ABC transporter ATP-binding protein [Solirubrobacteraceae bacterium]|nr:ABC transporter ATP-binding protein [Solirubrobacteraceae bacterium]
MATGGGTTIDAPGGNPEPPGAPAAPAVRLTGVRKAYGEVVAIEGLSMEVRPGEFFTMLGPSGSGKTTTLRIVAGFETADGGSVELHGEDVTGTPPYERPVNTVFQDYALFPHMSVLENVAYGLRVKGVGKRERSEQAAAALEMVRLPGVEGRRPVQLSGGQRQRVALARAIVNRPRVLLLDEPLGALDLKLREEMQIELKAIQRELSERITFVYVTHDQDEALTMSDRIAVFSNGRLEQVGTPGEIYERPVNEFVAGFVGTSNVLERDGRRVLIRPERIRLLAGGEDAPGALKGVVREVAYLGSVTRYVVESEHGETIVVLRQNLDTSAEQARQERGREVRLAWRAEDASVLEKEDRPALHAGLQEDRPAHRAGLESQQEADA